MYRFCLVGTRVELLIAGLDEAQARAAALAVLREFDRLHRTYHAWQASELSALNAAIAAGKTSTVTPEMSALIADAQNMAAAGALPIRSSRCALASSAGR